MNPFLTCSSLPHPLHRSPIRSPHRQSHCRPIWAIYAIVKPSMADVAVVLLDREGQVLAGEQLPLRDEPVEALPVAGDEDVPVDADLVEKSPAGRIITPTQLPGQGSPCHRVVGPPEPNLVFFPSTKCHISSICTMLSSGVAAGAGASSPPALIRL